MCKQWVEKALKRALELFLRLSPHQEESKA